MASQPGFDPSKGTYHRSDPPRGGNELNANFHYTSEENMLGMTLDDGKAKAFSKVKDGLKADSISKKVEGWALVHSDDVATHKTLSQAYADCFAAWEGDDATTAQKTFGQVVKTSEVMPGYTKNMHTATSNILKAVNEAKGTSSEGKDHYGPVVNPFSHSDGGKDEAAWQKLCGKIQGEWTTMDQQVESQHKDAGASPYRSMTPDPNGGGGVGGVSTPKTSATAAHTNAHVGKIPNTDNTTTHPKHPPVDWPPDPNNNTTTTGTDYDPNSPAYTGSGFDPHANGYSTSGAGVGTPSLDTSSSLAGYDPNASGMGGGAGVGSTGAGSGFAGSGVGSGGLSGYAGSGVGSGGLSGIGAGGSSGVGAGTGAGAAAGMAGEGAGGRGGTGMMAPMRGGGAGGNGDDERERSTWLAEDDDVWGEDDAPPSVIS